MGVDYDAVQAYGATVIAVGQYGSILRSTDRGITWGLPETSSFESLQDIAAFDESTWVAAGRNGAVIRSTDRGERWTLVPVESSANFSSVAAPTREVGYVLASSGLVLRSLNGGEQWDSIAQLGSGDIVSSAFLSASVGIAVGYEGTIYRTTDSGAAWVPVYKNPEITLTDVNFVNAQKGFVCCNPGNLLKTTDGGNTWYSVGTLGPEIESQQLAAIDSEHLIAIGANGIAAQPYAVAISDDTGTSWRPGTTNLWTYTTMVLTGIAVVNDRVAIAVGNLGIIMRTTDGGNSWETIANTLLDIPLFDKAPLRDIAFSSLDTGIIANKVLGRLGWLRTTDRGLTWVYHARNELEAFRNPHFFDANYGIAGVLYASSMYTTTDAGYSWQPLQSSREPLFHSTWSIQFVDKEIGYLAGDSIVYKTTDQGRTWTGKILSWPTTINTVMFVSEQIGFLGTQRSMLDGTSLYRVYKTTDGAQTWEIVYEVSDKGAVLRDVNFVDELHGYVALGLSSSISGDSGGRILSTSNGGVSWDTTKLAEGQAIDIEFFSPMNGIAVGTESVIYVTSDAGEHWSLERPWAYSGKSDVSDLYAVQLLPDRKTVIATGLGTILRKEFANYLSSAEIVKPKQPQSGKIIVSAVPNPAYSDALTISISDIGPTEIHNVSVDLYNIYGRHIKSLKADSHYGEGIVSTLVDLAGLANGIYTVVARDGNRIGNARVVVCR